MAESRDFANAATESSTAHALYLLRAATHASRTLQLMEQVVGCVARRQLTPELLRESLIAFIREHGASSTQQTNAAVARFFAGLATSTFLPAERDASPPELDRDELDRSLQPFASRALAVNVRALDTFVSRLSAVASGEVTPDAFRRSARKDYSRHLSTSLGRAATHWFQLLGDLGQAQAGASEQYLLGVLRQASPVGFDTDVVELTGAVDTTISTTVSLENTLPEPLVLHCAVSDLRRADGIGPAFPSRLVVSPAEIVLERDRSQDVRLSLWLDGAVYEPDASYVGALHVSREGAARVDVPLRVTPMAVSAP
jgi:hypothetical protein